MPVIGVAKTVFVGIGADHEALPERFRFLRKQQSSGLVFHSRMAGQALLQERTRDSGAAAAKIRDQFRISGASERMAARG